MKNYVEVAYEEKEKPYGEYPLQLARYLMERYGLTEGMTILDNGCGRGEFVHAFSKLGMKAIGTDISDYYKETYVVDLDKECLPFPDGHFDMVFSKSVVEHIHNTEHYMSEMYRVLKAGGMLILMVPDWESQYLIFYQDPTHIHPYTVKSVDRLLNMCGFKDVEVEKFVQIPSVWENKICSFLSYMLRKAGPVKKIYKNKFLRFSRELMVLGFGRKVGCGFDNIEDISKVKDYLLEIHL